MFSVEKVRDPANGCLMAMLLRDQPGHLPLGTEFHTQPWHPMQVGEIRRAKGHTIPPHQHCPTARTVLTTSELLLVRRGKVRVTFYGVEHDVTLSRYLTSVDLNAGDALLILDGGHSIDFLEDAELVEVKQGPFLDDKVPLNHEVADGSLRTP